MATRKTKKVEKGNEATQKNAWSVFVVWLRRCFIGNEEETPEPSHNILQAYVKGLRQYFQFLGRTCRYDYWGYITINILICFLLLFLNEYTPSRFFYFVCVYYFYLMIIPTITIFSRRLHDINMSFLLFGIFPIGACIWFVHHVYILSITYSEIGRRYLLDDNLATSMACYSVIFLWLYLLIITSLKGKYKINTFGKPVGENKSHNKKAKWMIFLNVVMQAPIIFFGLINLAFSFPWRW